MGRPEAPSLGISDSQSVKTTESDGPKGFDAGKKLEGRKRHLLENILGLLIAIFVAAASVQDRDAAPRLLNEANYERTVASSETWIRMTFIRAAARWLAA
jgi:putative transposase